MLAVLDAQDSTPAFGVDGVHTFHYTWERVTFVYGNPETRYAGVRFTLSFMLSARGA